MSRFLGEEVQPVKTGSAKITFHSDLSADRTVLELGEEATIFGMLFANSSNKAAEITGKDSAGAVKFTTTVGAKSTVPEHIKFTTSGGLVLEGLPGTSAPDVIATVFYTPGAV